MSVDYYLFSPSRKKIVMVGSNGLGGPKAWPTEYGGKEFLLWAIEEGLTDVELVTENDTRLEEDGIQDISDNGEDGPAPF